MYGKAKVFEVKDIGRVGEANLWGAVSLKGKPWQQLEIGESCDVVIRKTGGKDECHTVTRVDDRDAV